MDGVLEEYDLFRKAQPNAAVWPIASMGAAAKQLFELPDNNRRPELFLNEITYPTLFRTLLAELPKQ
jgi:hypothetical protein